MALHLRMPRISPDGSIALMGRLLSETGRQYAGRYAIAFVFMAMVAISMALSAWIMGDVVDDIFIDQKQHIVRFFYNA